MNGVVTILNQVTLHYCVHGLSQHFFPWKQLSVLILVLKVPNQELLSIHTNVY